MVVLAGLPHGPEDLAEDLQALAPLALQRLTEAGLGLGVGVGVRRVKGGDPDVQSLPHTGERLLLLDLGPVGESVAVGDL